MKEKIFAYLKIMPRAFLLGFVAFGILHLLLGWSIGEGFFWNTARNAVLTAFIWVGNAAISEEVNISWTDHPIRRLIVSFFLTVVITLLIAVAVDVTYCILRYGSIPESLFQGFHYWSILIITFFISLFMHGRSFLMSYKQAIVEQEELKRANLAGRYESLQNQVNPHFLFNSLNVLSSLVYKDADLSAKYIDQLADIYRYVLASQHREVIALDEERKMLESYLFLLDIRFGEQLNVTLDLPAVTEDALPPLSLQMLVENAVKHNVASRRNPLQLEILKRGDELIVRNNLQLKQQMHHSLGVGLSNIRERYTLLSNENIEIRQDDTSFEVRLPILKLTEYATADR